MQNYQGQIPRRNHPQNIEIHIVIPMNQAISGADHLLPGKLGVLRLDVNRDAISSFTDYFDQPGQSKVQQPVRIQIGPRSPLTNIDSLTSMG